MSAKLGDQIIGRTLFCRQKKSGKPYEVIMTGQHLQVLAHLYDESPASDWQMVRSLSGSVQLGARRCELRDAGLVQQAGTCPSGMTWKLSIAGRDLMLEVLAGA